MIISKQKHNLVQGKILTNNLSDKSDMISIDGKQR